eukprot:CAMPEP_0184670596 /NCGR_PEP_ID=MMETSP0308-20130426/82848_1 /TAXON_ID=38269 /ORGANISM="Gloeochaete witrockiana, Strain SAG 46.84" /LENGTH=106 /DNA_ID=CAMNT_0027117391 /DNA_START=1053 /DNA_END=1373 /DNA_ORIENTATION=-
MGWYCCFACFFVTAFFFFELPLLCVGGVPFETGEEKVKGTSRGALGVRVGVTGMLLESSLLMTGRHMGVGDEGEGDDCLNVALAVPRGWGEGEGEADGGFNVMSGP